LAWRAYDILIGSNFDVIVPGEAYRSAQLSSSQLQEKISIHGLRSVINLRGPHPGRAWYDDEVNACRQAGVSHFDIALSADRLPPPQALVQLIKVLRTAPEPLLVHCKQGADRTGLATAIWLILNRDVAPSQAAAKGLTLWHGHMPVGPTTAMDHFFDLYQNSMHSGGFARWAETDYPRIFKDQADIIKGQEHNLRNLMNWRWCSFPRWHPGAAARTLDGRQSQGLRGASHPVVAAVRTAADQASSNRFQ